MTDAKPATVAERYVIARKRLERLATTAGVPLVVSEDLIAVLSIAATADTERAARLAAEARVKVLEDALREFLSDVTLAGEMNLVIGPGHKSIERARAVIKEPANG